MFCIVNVINLLINKLIDFFFCRYQHLKQGKKVDLQIDSHGPLAHILYTLELLIQTQGKENEYSILAGFLHLSSQQIKTFLRPFNAETQKI